MQGGTYARAQKAGYKGKQLQFICDLARDTKDEAVNETLELIESRNFAQKEKKKREREEMFDKVKDILFLVAVLSIGFLIGYFCKR